MRQGELKISEANVEAPNSYRDLPECTACSALRGQPANEQGGC